MLGGCFQFHWFLGLSFFFPCFSFFFLFFYSSFSRTLKWELRLLIWDLFHLFKCIHLMIKIPPLCTGLAVSHKSYVVYFNYHSVQCIFYFPLRCLLWPVDYLEVRCLVSKCLEIFLWSFCYWFLIWFHYGQRTITLYNFNSFNFLEVCITVQHNYLSICSIVTWKNVYFAVAGGTVL